MRASTCACSAFILLRTRKPVRNSSSLGFLLLTEWVSLFIWCRLYHELTGELEAFVRDPMTHKSPLNLVNLYQDFIRTFQDKLNQIRLVSICSEISTQFAGKVLLFRRKRKNHDALNGKLKLRTVLKKIVRPI